MAFSLDTVPSTMVCHVNGHKIIKDLSLSELTFQVKVSNAWQNVSTRAKIENHGEVYTFNGTNEFEADYYILFGLKDDLVYPFLLSNITWRKLGSKTGKRRIVILKTERYSRRTKALKENRGWNCYVSDWPDGLRRRLQKCQLELL